LTGIRRIAAAWLGSHLRQFSVAVRRPPEGLEHTPREAIVVAADEPQVSGVPKAQLKIGGRLVIPVGADHRARELVRVTRVSANNYRNEGIADVRLVPFGEEGWAIAKEGEARACAPGATAGFSGNAGPEPRWRSGIVPID
jgi:hypothetical protein